MPTQNKCNLSNEELISKVQDWVSKLAKSGGSEWSLRVPVDFNHDPDVLITELCSRFQSTSQFSPPIKGRSFEQILEEDYHIQLEDTRRDESIKLAANKFLIEGKEEDPTVKSDVEEKKEGDITRYPTDEETIEVYSGMFDNNQPQSFIEENNPQNFELKEAKELIKGSNEDLAIEVTARFAGKSGGKNGRWKEPMKKQFIDGALWMRERLK